MTCGIGVNGDALHGDSTELFNKHINIITAKFSEFWIVTIPNFTIPEKNI
jgi:hypothetical protein